MINHKVEALNLLDLLRSTDHHHAIYMTKLRKEIDIDNLSLGELRTSEKELKKISVAGHRKVAYELLFALRSGTKHCFAFVQFLLDELKAGGLTLKDVGTDYEEVASLSIAT